MTPVEVGRHHIGVEVFPNVFLGDWRHTNIQAGCVAVAALQHRTVSILFNFSVDALGARHQPVAIAEAVPAGCERSRLVVAT